VIDFHPNLRIPQLPTQTPLPCHVLAVDDDALTRAQLMSLLNRAGYQAHGAGSGAEALAILSETPCPIVVTDWQMPDMDGLALCRALKLGAGDHYPYVMMLTIRGDAADILVGLEAGVDDYVVKGAGADDLLARIAAARSATRIRHSPRSGIARSRRLSLPDPLTGAHVSGFLTRYLALEIDRSRRRDHPTAILICDIDDIARINFRFGRKAGDQVLKAFVARSVGHMREPVDRIARVRGDEFVIVLPETTLDGARVVAKAIQLAMANNAIATSAGPVRTTVSIGVTALETPEERAGTLVVELLRAADQCLWISKASGKGCTTCLPLAAAALLTSSDATGSQYEIH
jgi:two-component system cell cycle response regulator